jgi:hypothetical protein
MKPLINAALSLKPVGIFSIPLQPMVMVIANE